MFLIKPFFLNEQKPKYFENEKSFWDEIKKILLQFYRDFNEANNTICFERWEPDFNLNRLLKQFNPLMHNVPKWLDTL